MNNRIEDKIPYLFTSPDTSGHGTLAAAVGAIIAELEPGTLYEHDGHDRSADELAKELLLIVAAQTVSGIDPPPIRFSRSHSSAPEAEFVIMRRDDATLYIVTDDSVVEVASSIDAPGLAPLPEIDPFAENESAKDLVGV